MKSTGLPLVAGGLLDQPHLWMMQWEVIEGVAQLFETQDRISEQLPQPKDLMAPLRFGK